MNRGSTYACAAGAVLLFACGKQDVGSTASALEFCTTTRGIAADNAARCMKMSPAARASFVERGAPTCASVAHEVQMGRASYDPARGAACARAMAEMWDCAFSGVAPEAKLDDCRLALRGKVDAGGECWSNVDCDGACLLAWPSCSGRCTRPAAVGDSCDALPCLPGLSCTLELVSGSTYSGRCRVASGPGGPCPCRDGFYCGADQTCQPQRTSGFCERWNECADGFACAGSPGMCLRIAGEGESCGIRPCGFGYRCDAASSTCVVLPDIGQRCVLEIDGTTGELQCVSGWCDVDGTKACRAPKGEGEPCGDWGPQAFPGRHGQECDGYCDPTTQRCVALTSATCTAP
jgi:hypothetical protein